MLHQGSRQALGHGPDELEPAVGRSGAVEVGELELEVGQDALSEGGQRAQEIAGAIVDWGCATADGEPGVETGEFGHVVGDGAGWLV